MQNLNQEAFLQKCINDKLAVNVYLVNGIKLQGVITHADADTVILTNTVSQMAYKHAISTVVPVQVKG